MSKIEGSRWKMIIDVLACHGSLWCEIIMYFVSLSTLVFSNGLHNWGSAHLRSHALILIWQRHKLISELLTFKKYIKKFPKY